MSSTFAGGSTLTASSWDERGWGQGEDVVGGDARDVHLGFGALLDEFGAFESESSATSGGCAGGRVVAGVVFLGVLGPATLELGGEG